MLTNQVLCALERRVLFNRGPDPLLSLAGLLGLAEIAEIYAESTVALPPPEFS